MSRPSPFTLSSALLLCLVCMAAHAQAPALPPGTSTPEAARPSTTPQPDPLTQAEDKLAAGDRPGARALLTTYLSAHTGDARAWFDLGYIEDADGHESAAESDYRRAINADPKQFEAHLALGLLLAPRTDTTAEARQQLQTALTLTPNPPNPAAQAQAGRALARLLVTTDPAGARDALINALKLSPETPADTLLTAQIAEAAGDPDTAKEAYTTTLATAPAGSGIALEATSGLAHLLIAGKQFERAELILRKALAKNAADPALNTQLAQVLVEEGKREDAIAVLENLHAAQPGEPAITRMLAGLYTDAGEPAKADPLYAQLMATTRTPDAALLAARGDNLVRQRKYAEAVAILQQASKLAPSDGNVWSSLAFAASEDHQPQLVLDALAMRSKVMSDTPATYFLCATAYDSLHQTRMAVEMYKQFLAVAGGKFPDEEWQAKHRLVALAH